MVLFFEYVEKIFVEIKFKILIEIFDFYIFLGV